MFRKARFLCVLSVIAASCGAPSLDKYPHSSSSHRPSNVFVVIYPHIVPGQNTVPTRRVSYGFRFESRDYEISVDIDEAVYAGSQTANKHIEGLDDRSAVELRKDYYTALIEDPLQLPFYEALLHELRAIRSREKLSDERYVELIAVFVQSIEGCVDSGPREPQFPIATFGNQCGDCDDKSLLLAALLSHEGYASALLFFFREGHMAAGVQSEELAFRNTGYACIETNTVALVGLCASVDQLQSVPEVIRISGGDKTYESGHQVTYLLKTIGSLRERTEELAGRVQNLKKRSEALDAKSDDIEAEIERLREQHKSRAAIIQYFVEHQDDRPGLYKWVRSTMDSLDAGQ